MHKQVFFGAIMQGNVEAVKKIISETPELTNAVDTRGFPALTLSTYLDQPEITKALLEGGADQSQRDASGNTAFMGVCFKGNLPLTQMLLEAGAEVNLKNTQGQTALAFAATYGHLDIASFLLNHGADASIPDAQGKTPVFHARSNGHEDVALAIEAAAN